jgi:hypothetical protein
MYFQLLLTQQHSKYNSTFHASHFAMLKTNQLKFQILQNDKHDHTFIFYKTVILNKNVHSVLAETGSIS